MKKVLLVSMILCLLFMVQGAGPAPAQEGGKVKVGVIWGLTGPGSQFQKPLCDSTVLAGEWINSKGGIKINGKKYLIEMIVEDSKNTPAGAVSAATKLVFQDKVNFIVGTIVPTYIDAIASVSEPNKVIHVAYMNTRVYPDRPYSFVSLYSFASPVPGMYSALVDVYPQVKSVAYIINDETGAQAIAKLSQTIAKSRGLTVLDVETHPYETSDYYPIWTKVLAKKPDAVDIGGRMPNTTAACVRHGRELGFKGPIINGNPTDVNTLVPMIGKDFATDVITASYNVNGPEVPPTVKEIQKLWESKYDKSNPFKADLPNCFNMTWTLVQAMEKAQSLDTAAIRDAWQKMQTMEVATGKARIGGAKTFGINNMVYAPCPISRMKDGKVEFIKWYDPWMP